MELRDITLDDLPLYERIHCDPDMMSELGGPLPSAGLADKLRRDVRGVESGLSWFFKIIPAGDAAGEPSDVDDTSATGNAAGIVCVWDRPWQGQQITEIGWMVLPRFQRRGLGKAAVRTVLDRARSQRRWTVVHAFPAVGNAASNAICRSAAFTKVAEIDHEFRGQLLRCNHWRLELHATPPPR